MLELLADVEGVSMRRMMGEYLVYASGKLVGGVYDDRFLVKAIGASRAAFSVAEAPYERGSEMMLVDMEDGAAVAALVADMLPELSEPRKRLR